MKRWLVMVLGVVIGGSGMGFALGGTGGAAGMQGVTTVGAGTQGATMAGATTQGAGVPAGTEPALQDTQFYLGVAVEGIPPSISKLMKLQPGQGLLVTKVIPKSPAAKAKLRVNDLLVSIDGKPAVHQRQLVDAANKLRRTASGIEAAPSRLTYIREGEPATVAIVPAPRPAELAVLGNARGFTPATVERPRGGYHVVYETAEGQTVQVGPGYMVDLTAPNTVLSKSIQSYVSKGQTIIMSQEVDGAGSVKNSITVGDKTYDFDAATVETLPADLRELARPLLKEPKASGRGRVETAGAGGGGDGTIELLKQRIAQQDKQIEELNRKLDALIKAVEGKERRE